MSRQLNVKATASEIAQMLIDNNVAPSDVRNLISTRHPHIRSQEGVIDAIVNMTIHCLRKQKQIAFAKALATYSNSSIAGATQGKIKELDPHDVEGIPTNLTERNQYINALLKEKKYPAIQHILVTIPRNQWSTQEYYFACRLVFETNRNQSLPIIQEAKSRCHGSEFMQSFIELEAMVIQGDNKFKEALDVLNTTRMEEWSTYTFALSIQIAKEISSDILTEYATQALKFFPRNAIIFTEYLKACSRKRMAPNKNLFQELQQIEPSVELLGIITRCASDGLVPIEIANMLLLHARKYDLISRRDFQRIREDFSELLDRDELIVQNHARSGFFEEVELRNVKPVDRVAYRVAYNRQAPKEREG